MVWCPECPPGLCIENDYLRDEDEQILEFRSFKEAEDYFDDWADGAPFKAEIEEHP